MVNVLDEDRSFPMHWAAYRGKNDIDVFGLVFPVLVLVRKEYYIAKNERKLSRA